GRLARRFHSADEMRADDSAAALLEFANGATGSVILAGYRLSPTWIEMQIAGERGLLRLDSQGVAVSRGAGWRGVPVEERDMMELEWEAFAGAILGERDLPISLDYALRVMSALFDLEASCASKQAQ